MNQAKKPQWQGPTADEIAAPGFFEKLEAQNLASQEAIARELATIRKRLGYAQIPQLPPVELTDKMLVAMISALGAALAGPDDSDGGPFSSKTHADMHRATEWCRSQISKRAHEKARKTKSGAGRK